MMLIDEIRAALKPNSGRSVWFLEHLNHATVIKVRNVADYIFQSPPTQWDLENDFPNIAPPFDDIWMEWSHICDWGFSHTKPCIQPVRVPMGILLYSIELHHKVLDSVPAVVRLRLIPKAKWLTLGFFTWKGLDNALFHPPGVGWCVTAEGNLVYGDETLMTLAHPLAPSEEMTEEDRKFSSSLSWFLPIPYMALSFMHCAKTEMVKSPPHHQKLQQARARKNKPPLVRWHTLVIDPIRKIVASANGGNDNLTPKSLHICRGHFKKFGEKYGNRDLFGKYNGMFWWPMHARGALEAGVVFKDYKVRPAPAIGSVDGR